jgi:lysozyme
MARGWKARRWLWSIGLAAGLAATAVVVAPHAYPHIELAPLFYPVVGVDVSNYQGEIDWPALAASGVAFAYIKATEGATFRDKRFAENWSAAYRAGIPRGGYHFFTLCRSGAEQARNFIETVPTDPSALPPVVDAEHMGPCPGAPTPDNHIVIAMLKEFIATFESHYGRRPLVYTTLDFETAMLDGALAGERFWLRSLVIPPTFRSSEWLIWQFHNRGRRPGVTGDLDLNVFRGTQAEFDRFVRGTTVAVQP